MRDLLCHPLGTHAVILQKQLDTTHKPGMKRQGCRLEIHQILQQIVVFFCLVFSSCVTRVFFLLCIAEQVEAQRVGWWEDVIEEVHSSF